MTISSKELAGLLNLSPATVSMVLNNKPGISQATRDMVLEAAQKYGYSPKKSGSQSKCRTVHFILYKKHGKIVTDSPFFSQIMEGIDQECSRQGCELLISYFYESESFDSQLKKLKETPCDAVILQATEMDAKNVAPFAAFGVPLVLLDYYDDTLEQDCVMINNVQGAYRATTELIRAGHRLPGYLRSSVEIGNFRERADGYYKALRHAKIDTSHPFVHKIPPLAEEGYAAMCAWLDEKPELTSAYFADNDIIAAAAIRALKQYGYRIPEDISIIGFDDMPFGSLIDPPLCTMRVDKGLLGSEAVKLAVSRIPADPRAAASVPATSAPRETALASGALPKGKRTLATRSMQPVSGIKMEISTTYVKRKSILYMEEKE